MLRRIVCLALWGLVACSLHWAARTSAWAQGGGEEQNPGIAGVLIDANGVLRIEIFDPRAQAAQVEAARAGLPPNLAKPSELRKISLTRLEAAIGRQLDMGRQLTNEMRHLVGLTRVQYVFLYPETGDIVIAGPAEPWAEDASGRVRGLESGRPIVELQDLVVALRAFPPGGANSPMIGCSIDATPEGLASLQDFIKQQMPRTVSANTDVRPIAAAMRTSLGNQVVSVLGVSPQTHFAQVLVEADYRMKLIGIGLEQPPIKLASYVSLANPSQVARNAMQRWFFTPNYECLRVSEDEQALELVGLGVKLVNADEVVQADGSRAATGSVDRASRRFVDSFTKKYPELAAKSPVYAQLRNLIDLSVVAAYMQQRDFYGRASWTAATFADEQKLPVETYQAPVEVPSAINLLQKGGQWMMPIGGGVSIEAAQALDAENLLEDEGGGVQKARGEITLDHLTEGQWWWD